MATAALRFVIARLRYGAAGESGATIPFRGIKDRNGNVQRLKRRQVKVDKRFSTAGAAWGVDKLNREIASQTSLRRETITPPPSPKQTFSLPKLKTPASPKLPTACPSIAAPMA